MQQGNKKAFDTLFIKYYAMLCAFARSFVSLEDAEEVVQDTMLQIWEIENKSYRFFCSSLFVQGSKKQMLYLNDQKFSSIPNRKYTHSGHTGTIRRS